MVARTGATRLRIVRSQAPCHSRAPISSQATHPPTCVTFGASERTAGRARSAETPGNTRAHDEADELYNHAAWLFCLREKQTTPTGEHRGDTVRGLNPSPLHFGFVSEKDRGDSGRVDYGRPSWFGDEVR